MKTNDVAGDDCINETRQSAPKVMVTLPMLPMVIIKVTATTRIMIMITIKVIIMIIIMIIMIIMIMSGWRGCCGSRWRATRAGG